MTSRYPRKASENRVTPVVGVKEAAIDAVEDLDDSYVPSMSEDVSEVEFVSSDSEPRSEAASISNLNAGTLPKEIRKRTVERYDIGEGVIDGYFFKPSRKKISEKKFIELYEEYLGTVEGQKDTIRNYKTLKPKLDEAMQKLQSAWDSNDVQVLPLQQKASKMVKPETKKYESKATRSALIFPVGRIARYLRQRKYGERTGISAAVYMAAVLQYMAFELTELSGDIVKNLKKRRIQPRHILLAVRGDEELDKVIDGTIASGGVIPHIYKNLITTKVKRRKKINK